VLEREGRRERRGDLKGFHWGRIAECYRGRHDSAPGRDRRSHVHRGRAASGPRARPRARLRCGPDLPEKPATVGGETAHARRNAGYRVKVALENTAGAGNTIGRTFGELATLIERAARPERIGVCLDTCHLFAAGYNIRTAAGYRRAMGECEATIGRRRVVAFHLNDAKAPLGSGLDRHENIGRGLLWLAPFRLLLNDHRFAAVPKVLETPKEPAPASDLRNLAVLRRLRRRLGR